MRVAILTTGGTIEKTYDEADGSLRNVGSVLQEILRRLRLTGLEIRHVPVMSKDSRDMTDEDRDAILAAVREALSTEDAVIVIHGTDTLTVTGDHIHTKLVGREYGSLSSAESVSSSSLSLAKPVILTGAMRPYEFRDTDADQNLTEALLACRLLPPGVYAVLHNNALRFPGVVKDRERMTFVRG